MRRLAMGLLLLASLVPGRLWAGGPAPSEDEPAVKPRPRPVSSAPT